MACSSIPRRRAYVYCTELVSEVSAPLSVAKLRDDRRNNI